MRRDPYKQFPQVELGDIVRVVPTDLGIMPERLLQPPDLSVPPPRIVDGMKYGSFQNAALVIGTTSQLVLPQPATRRIYFLLQNTHPTQNLYIAFGTPASAGIGVKIIPGGNFEFNNAVPQDDVYLIADGLVTTAIMLYANKGERE